MVRAAAKERAIANAVAERLTGTIGFMTDELIKLRGQKRELEAQVAEIETSYNSMAEALMTRLENEGTSKGTGKLGTASISLSTVPTVTDWDTFGAYVVKTKQTHLFERRVSTAAWRELFEKKGAVPGTEPFNKKRLNLRGL